MSDSVYSEGYFRGTVNKKEYLPYVVWRSWHVSDVWELEMDELNDLIKLLMRMREESKGG